MPVTRPATDPAITSSTVDVLDRLHRAKDAVYGDAWLRRGEVLGIFANLARKYDRLTIAFAMESTSAVEPLVDTVADLAVYAAKYLTWLAEQHPDAFIAAIPYSDAAERSAARGPDALLCVLADLPEWERRAEVTPPDSTTEAWARIRTAFDPLDAGLQAQSVGSDGPSIQERLDAAWRLTDACVHLLTLMRQADDRVLTGLDAIARGGAL
jgi:hypothetical protein